MKGWDKEGWFNVRDYPVPDAKPAFALETAGKRMVRFYDVDSNIIARVFSSHAPTFTKDQIEGEVYLDGLRTALDFVEYVKTTWGTTEHDIAMRKPDLPPRD